MDKEKTDALYKKIKQLITRDPLLGQKAQTVVTNSWVLDHLPKNVGPYQMLVVARLSGDVELLREAEEVYVTSFEGRRYPEDRAKTGPITTPDSSQPDGYVHGVDAILRHIDTEAKNLEKPAAKLKKTNRDAKSIAERGHGQGNFGTGTPG